MHECTFSSHTRGELSQRVDEDNFGLTIALAHTRSAGLARCCYAGYTVLLDSRTRLIPCRSTSKRDSAFPSCAPGCRISHTTQACRGIEELDGQI